MARSQLPCSHWGGARSSLDAFRKGRVGWTEHWDNIPQVLQRSGPPAAVVQVLAILHANPVVLRFSAFLAVLGKQWLNRYAPVDTRGSPNERSQNRQREPGGAVAWYFEYVRESLPLMLQGALFLLGCALPIYLWGIDTTVSPAVFGVTAFAAVFHGVIIVAGTISVGCPYLNAIRTSGPFVTSSAVSSPSSQIRRVWLPPPSPTVRNPTAVAVSFWRDLEWNRWVRVDCACVVTFLSLPHSIYHLPLVRPTFMVYVYDTCFLTLAIFRAFCDFASRVRGWFLGARGSALKGPSNYSR